jgi:hypothetical protein
VLNGGLDQLEGGGGLPLVPGEGGALRESIRNHEQALGGHLLDVDRTTRRDLVVPFGGDLDDGRFLLVAGELAGDPLAQAADDLVLFQGRKADQNRHAVTEEGHKPLLSCPEGKGCRG